MHSVAAVVLTGGMSSRLGGAHKPAELVGEASILARVLAALIRLDSVLPVDEPTIVVAGSPMGVPDYIEVVSEEPPLGGPVAGLAAGLVELDRQRQNPHFILTLAGDLPFVSTADCAELLIAAGLGPDNAVDRRVAVAVDVTGQPQWLCAAWPTTRLRERLAALEAERGSLAGTSMRTLTQPEPWTPVVVREGATFDVDTPEDLHAARARVASAEGTVQPWHASEVR